MSAVMPAHLPLPKYFGVAPVQVATRKGDFVIGIEKMADVREEISPLHILHWNEIEVGHSSLNMDVDYEGYESSEDRGQFVLFTVRAPGLMLAGYLMCYMYRTNHSKKQLVAREDAMFLHRSYRGSGVANKLLDFAHAALKEMGCMTLALSSRHYAGGSNLTHWLTGKGYKPSAVVFVKDLQ